MTPSPLNPQGTGQRYLLDTNVISALAPDRNVHLPTGLSDWLSAQTTQLYIPSIAVVELAQGIAKLKRAGGIERANRFDSWLDGLIDSFSDRIVLLDAASARLAGQMSDAAMAHGKHPGFADVAIAALAIHNGFLLLTRNLKHFEPLGVACADPLSGLTFVSF